MIRRMFLSRTLFIALIDVFCKSSHRIVRLMPSARDCHPDGGDCALEQEDRTIGREDERTTRGRGDDEKRMGWEQRCRVCRGALPQGGGSWF